VYSARRDRPKASKHWSWGFVIWTLARGSAFVRINANCDVLRVGCQQFFMNHWWLQGAKTKCPFAIWPQLSQNVTNTRALGNEIRYCYWISEICVFVATTKTLVILHLQREHNPAWLTWTINCYAWKFYTLKKELMIKIWNFASFFL